MARILLVEDDESARGVMQALLKYEGHEVFLAANGRQGLLLAKERSPDLVLSDIRMPGMTGTEFCRELRKDPSTKDVYVILATGHDTPEVKTEGLAAGADDYIGKPVRADELSARIRMGNRIRSLQREVAEFRTRAQETEQKRAGLEGTLSRFGTLRGELTEAMGALLDTARRAQDACRQGDVKFTSTAVGKLEEEIRKIQSRIAPRE